MRGRTITIGVGLAPVRGSIITFPTSLLFDNFDDNSTSASWVTGAPLVSGSVGGTVVETNQRVEVTPPSSAAGGNYNGYTSATTYDFRGSRTFVKVSNVAGLSGSQDVFFALGVSTANYCGILVEGSSLLVHSLIAGASTLPFSTTYSSTTHAWWALRVSSDGGTVYIETAPSTASDSPLEGDWTVLYSLAADTSWTVSAAKVSFGSGTWQSLASPSVIQFDGFNTAMSSADVTAALTGQSLSIAQGSLLASTALALTGQSAIIAQGLLTPATSGALSGQSVTVAQGSIAGATSEALSGQSLTGAQGSVTQSRDIALSGQGMTLTQGSVSPVISIALSGQSLIVSQGSVTAINGVTAALTGQSLAAEQGSISSTVSAALTGQALVVAIGSVTVASSDATTNLTGQGISLGLGILVATVVNGSPQLQDITVNGENIVNEPLPAAGSLNFLTEPSGQIVNTPFPPAAELA